MAPSKRAAHAVARASLSFTAPTTNSMTAAVLVEGWVLKKRRKKMQGFARRYFILFENGVLAYSFEPNQPFRDQIQLHSAAISSSPRRNEFHIDSDVATFHVKCLDHNSYLVWIFALRKFIPEPRKSSSVRAASLRRGSLHLNRSGAVIDEMAATISELEEALAQLNDNLHKKPSSGKLKESKDGKIKHESKDTKAMFGLFKKGTHSSEHETHPNTNRTSDLPNPALSRLTVAIGTLKAQHSSLYKSMYNLTLDMAPTKSPLPRTDEDDEDDNNQKRKSLAGSISTLSDLADSFYDASDALDEGLEEFHLDEQISPDLGHPSRITNHESHSSLILGDSSSIDTDIVPDEPPEHDHSAVVRRKQLPSPVTGDEGSLFAILKKNVGKDLATIAVPVSFNEPLTLLQRAAEEMEYFSLLDDAASSDDPIHRLRFIAAFAVSGYAHTRHRSGRKGFNPLLAETFEDSRMSFIAEKVRHNPLEMAYHAEGKEKAWELWATSSGKTKFWGKSLEIIPLGVTHLKIGNDHFQWNKPSSFMRNLMLGTKYLEHCGSMTIENTRDKSRCVLDFKQSGYWAASNVVSGTIYGANGQVAAQLEGKWDEQFADAIDSSHLHILWRASAWPKNTEEYYGFTQFGMTLNEITPDIAKKLPPTDSRLRPDVRALEDGNIDVAEAEKLRVEEVQRARRREGHDRAPRWFKEKDGEWVYAGGYWESRAKGWKGETIESLW